MKRPKIQFAALPFRTRDDGRLEVLLITSRDTGRWIIPKGWPMKGKKPFDAAAQEAWEEAGVLGRVGRKALGQYGYEKASADRSSSMRLKVKVFPLEVEMTDTAWPEYGQRVRRWHAPEDAASLVDEDALSALIRDFARVRRNEADNGNADTGNADNGNAEGEPGRPGGQAARAA